MAQYNQPHVAEFLDEVSRQRTPCPSVEPPTAEMFDAYLKVSAGVSYQAHIFNSLSNDAATSMERRRLNSMAAVSGFRNALTYYQINAAKERGKVFNDIEVSSNGTWLHTMAAMAADLAEPDHFRTEAAKQFVPFLMFMDACTPVKERMNPVELISQLAAERFPNGARLLEIGSSAMHGALHIMHKDVTSQLDFASALYLEPGTSKIINVQQQATNLLQSPTNIRQCICVDKYPIFDEDRNKFDETYVNYAEAGWRPSERNNEAYVATARKLLKAKIAEPQAEDTPKSVVFECADLLKSDDLESFKSKYSEPFDIITINFVTQEIAREDQIRLHEILKGLLSENGLIIYNHQAHIRDADDGPVDFNSVVPYRSYAGRDAIWLSECHVYDALQPEAGIQHFANFYDNRCRDIRIATAGKLAVNGSVEPLFDLLKSS